MHQVMKAYGDDNFAASRKDDVEQERTVFRDEMRVLKDLIAPDNNRVYKIFQEAFSENDDKNVCKYSKIESIFENGEQEVYEKLLDVKRSASKLKLLIKLLHKTDFRI